MRVHRLRFLTRVTVLIVAGVAGTHAGQASYKGTQVHSRYQRVALALVDAPAEQRRAFAQIAITALAEVYIAEADLARSEARISDPDRDKLHWAGSVDRFTEKLLNLSDALQGEALVTVLANDLRGPVALAVGEHRLMLSHPRDRQQEVFEQAVLDSFCRMDNCAQLLPSIEDTRGVPVSSQAPLVEWEFTASGIVCSSEDLRLGFDSGVPTSRVKDFCQQIHLELSGLLRELRRQLNQGVVVDWAVLEVEQRSDQAGHLVRLNRAGDSVLLRLPVLSATPGFIDTLGAWFQQHAAGPLEVQAADYGWLEP